MERFALEAEAICFYLFILGWAESSLLHRLSSCGEQGLLSSCGAWASHCGGFSRCRVWALGLEGLSSCGTWVR